MALWNKHKNNQFQTSYIQKEHSKEDLLKFFNSPADKSIIETQIFETTQSRLRAIFPITSLYSNKFHMSAIKFYDYL